MTYCISDGYSAVELLYMETPVGGIVIEIQKHGLSRLSFTASPNCAKLHPKSKLGNLAYSQLMHYFDKPHDQFTVPLLFFEQTPFRRRVWKALSEIGLGTTTTYKQIAQKLNTHPRAVGGACAANPIPIIIPCHRVVAESGALCGYTGADGKQDLGIKTWLLDHEEKLRLMQ